MSSKNLKFFRSGSLVKFLFFFTIIFSLSGIFSNVNAQAGPPFTIKKCSAGVDTVGGSTSNPDVSCRCAINECRLSNGVFSYRQQLSPGEYICITGNPNPTYILGSNPNDTVVERFRDSAVYEAQGIGSNTPGNLNNQINFKGYLFLDLFAMDTLQTAIPVGSVCKTHATDPNGVAYWYYPGYFNIIQGIDPGLPNVNPNPPLGGACPTGTRILFSTTDLFGNTVTGTQTFFGCLPNSPNGLVAFLVRLLSGISLVVTLLIAGINLIQIIMNSTSPDAIAEHQKKMLAAITTFIGIMLGITLLSILGIQIIGLGNEGIGGSIFRFFVGG